MRSVVYDLKKRPVSWDFITFAISARELGYRHIVFRNMRGNKTLQTQQVIDRVHNIMIPAIKMLGGMAYSMDGDGDERVASHEYYYMRPDFERMMSPRKAEVEHTVTIRDVPYAAQRNSDRNLWTRFAKQIGALLIEEYDRVPISFEDRLAYYAGARMNWGVTNGPLSAMFLTPYPISMFCDERLDRKCFAGHGILPGGQVQFSLPHQNLIWGAINYDNLMRHYERIQLADRNPRVGPELCRCALAGYTPRSQRSSQ